MLFFPILRERSPRIAVAYVCTRVMEALLLIVGVLFLLCILQLGESAQGQTTPELVTLSRLLSKGNFWAYQLAMLILGTGSVAFCLSLYRFSGPGGLFELFLGGWLITKGFRTLTPFVAA